MEYIKLVKKAKKGDKEALIKLIMNKKEEYYKLSYTYMKNQEDTLDAMEDMILVLYEKVHRLKKEEAFYSWSKTILVNCCKRMLKRRKKIISLENVKEKGDSETIEQKNRELILDEHMSKLNKNHREAIELRYFLDLDYKTISTILKIPIGTVKSRISIGLKKLKESFGGYIYE